MRPETVDELVGGELEAQGRRRERGRWIGPRDDEAEPGHPAVEGFAGREVRGGDLREKGEVGGEVGAEPRRVRRLAPGRSEPMDSQGEERDPAPEADGEDPGRERLGVGMGVGLGIGALADAPEGDEVEAAQGLDDPGGVMGGEGEAGLDETGPGEGVPGERVLGVGAERERSGARHGTSQPERSPDSKSWEKRKPLPATTSSGASREALASDVPAKTVTRGV